MSISPKLKKVMSDYGFSREAQFGIFLLFVMYKIDIPDNFSTLNAANTWFKTNTQKFLRKGQERWSPETLEMNEEFLTNNLSQLQKAANLLGMLQKIEPRFNDSPSRTTFSIIPGGHEKCVVNLRLPSFLESLKKFDCAGVFFSGGVRELTADECQDIALKERTEMEMGKYHILRAFLEYGLNIPYYPVKGIPDPGKPRANTKNASDALWNHPVLKPGSRIILHVEQPYAQRFFEIYGSTLTAMDCELRIASIPLNLPDLELEPAIIGDELARWIDQLSHRVEVSQSVLDPLNNHR